MSIVCGKHALRIDVTQNESQEKTPEGREANRGTSYNALRILAEEECAELRQNRVLSTSNSNGASNQ